MKKLTFLLLLSLFVLANTQPLSDGEKTQPNYTSKTTSELADAPFNKEIFKKEMKQKMGNKVVGYSVVVGNEQGIQAKASNGWAQKPSSGNVPMKTNVASGIGSVVKTVSAVGLLHIFSTHIYSERTVQQQLDMKIIRKLPRKWRQEFANCGIGNITYRHLLQHKSGISKTKAAVENAKKAGYKYEKGFYHFLNMKYGFTPENVGKKRKYENSNIGLMIWLIPALAYPIKVKAINDKYDHINDPKEYSQAMVDAYAKLYEKYIRENIFAKVQPAMKSPMFRPIRTVKMAKCYNAKGEWDIIKSTHARPQGGWMMSGQDFANFARTFLYTNTFFGPVTKRSLFVDDSYQTRDDRIVFSGVKKDTRFSDKTDYYPSHNGAQKSYRAVFTVLPNNHYAIIMTNSKVRGAEDTNNFLLKTVFDAYYSATRKAVGGVSGN